MSQYQQDVNAVNIINWCNTVLKSNKNGTTFERAIMARFLLHLVGDIHQPLHSTMMFNNTYKNGDQGGNSSHKQGNLISIITLANKTFNKNNKTVLNAWRLSKLINFGDDYVPTGLFFDTLVTLLNS